MASVAEQVRMIQPRIETSDLLGSCQIDETAPDGPTPADLDWFAHQGGCDLSEPVAGILGFPAWIKVQASYLRSLGSDAGDWLAGKLDELAAAPTSPGPRAPNSTLSAPRSSVRSPPPAPPSASCAATPPPWRRATGRRPPRSWIASRTSRRYCGKTSRMHAGQGCPFSRPDHVRLCRHDLQFSESPGIRSLHPHPAGANP